MCDSVDDLFIILSISFHYSCLCDCCLYFSFNFAPVNFKSATRCARQLEEVGNYILHELLADHSDIFTEGSAEHHHLFLVGRHPEDLLDITPHV